MYIAPPFSETEFAKNIKLLNSNPAELWIEIEPPSDFALFFLNIEFYNVMLSLFINERQPYLGVSLFRNWESDTTIEIVFSTEMHPL